MTLHLVPPGRGRWHVVVMTLQGDRAAPLLFAVGQRVRLGGLEFRIAKVIHEG